MDMRSVKVEVPDGANLIAGQTHFIKTVEDLYEIFTNSVPGIKFGIAFSEASGDCLIRWEGNDQDLTRAAIEIARKVAAGHFFVALMKNAYPINVLTAVKACPEVCRIFCATANPVEILVVESEQGGGVVGVIDGFRPKGVEDEAGKKWRKDLLRKIGYKL
ncbi:MAG: adenosine-specific kinase [bacterium]